jgi:coenzyme F420-reducing hydrogenase alpha subunit
LLPELKWGLQASIDTLKLVAGFDFPVLELDYEMVCLKHQSEYPMSEGRVVAGSGLDVPVEEYERHFEERQVKHSTALHSFMLPAQKSYLVGPLARINLCFDQLSPTAKREAEACKIDWPCRNNFKSIVARAVELIHAYEEAIRIVKAYQAELTLSRVAFTPKAGEGCHATEAPRGLLYHHYRIGADGMIAEARIVPPTSQNQGQIEADLRVFLPSVLSYDDTTATRRCEHLIRNYDPCISCATHFLRLRIDRGTT